ncbi:MAG: 4-(cytidine 5'-diphospho)-2-C-methyl-D-erythritol kinase [Planctomycetota bacterium]
MILASVGNQVIVQAPAKVNLFLELLNRRTDGYHELETLMVAVTIFDTIVFTTTVKDHVRLTCSTSTGTRALEVAMGAGASLSGEVPVSGTNLVTRAVTRLRQAAGVSAGADVHLIKRIPSAAGFGGASSDAASALLAANEAWQVQWSRAELARIAADLGSDVPFFLGHGAAICRGRGELIEPLSVPSSLHVVVVRPPEGLSTALVYQHCSVAAERAGVQPLVAALRQGDSGSVARHLFNRLEPAAARLTPWIARLRRVFGHLDCLGHQMSGSGTGYFGICRHARHARRVAARLRSEQVGYVRVATTFSKP